MNLERWRLIGHKKAAENWLLEDEKTELRHKLYHKEDRVVVEIVQRKNLCFTLYKKGERELGIKYLFMFKIFYFISLLKAKRDTLRREGVLSFKEFCFTGYSVKQIRFFSLRGPAV